MRVVVNEAQIKRNRQISHILFFISLAGMGLGFFYTWTSEPDSSTSQISCFILPILMLLTLSSVRMANTWIREPRPKDVLANSLKGLGKRYTIFHYVLPAPHVLVGPEGVFTLTTVWQEGKYRVEGKKWRGDEGITRKIMGYLRQDLIGNPYADAVFHAQQIQKLVNKIEPDSGIEVQPLVVILHPNTQVELDDPLFPVLYADSKQRPSLRGYLKEIASANRRTLSDEALDTIDRTYGLMTRQEIAEMLGQSLDELGDDDDAGSDELGAPAPADEAPQAGTVFVAQAGQLFYIGSTSDLPQDTIAENGLQDEVPEEITVIHTFEDSNAARTARRLQQKFDRKRQKEHWYGLSKKDIAWLTAQQGDLD